MRETVKKIPIFFSTPMVQAILNTKPGTWPPEPIDPSRPCKGMTRRVVKLRYTHRYQPGDILWVRETWADLRGMGFGNDPQNDRPWNFAYKADIKQGSDSDRARIDYGVKWKPSIHMPREAARILLVVWGVKIERLQNITEYDARLEGCKSVSEFACLWDSLNAKRGFEWKTTPRVRAISFVRLDSEGVNPK